MKVCIWYAWYRRVQEYLFADQISAFTGKICIYICNYFDVFFLEESKTDFQFLQTFRFITFVCKLPTNFIIGKIKSTSESCVYILLSKTLCKFKKQLMQCKSYKRSGWHHCAGKDFEKWDFIPLHENIKG